MTDRMKYALSGAAAGAVNGLFGGGGGMVLAPALTGWCHMEQKRALATCVAAILPLCLLSAAISLWLRRIFACFLLYGGVRYLL